MLVYMQTAPLRRADLWALPLAGGPARPLVNGPFDDSAAAFSPDSKLVAFQSAETGRWEIYLQRLRDGRRLVVSTDGGERPDLGAGRTLLPVARSPCPSHDRRRGNLPY